MQRKSVVIKACSPIVAEVATIIEFAGNKPDFLIAASVICWLDSESILPFLRISSMTNQGIVPFSQKSEFAVDGVYPLRVSNSSVSAILSYPPPRAFFRRTKEVRRDSTRTAFGGL